MRNVAASKKNVLNTAGRTSLHNHNLAIIAKAVITGSLPDPSRAYLAKITGLNRSTLSRLVEQLIAYGIIRELDSKNIGSGRPAVPLAPALHTYASIGVDIMRDSIEASVVDLSGQILAQQYLQTETEEAAKTLVLVGRIISDLHERARNADLIVVDVTAALHGYFDRNGTHLLSSPTLGWTDVDLARSLHIGREKKYMPAISFLNSADAGAYAENYLRNKHGEPLSDFLYVSGGSGIDAALMKNGSFDAGYHGWAGELGHVYVAEGTNVCSCGNTGCLESFAGQNAIMAASGFSQDSPIGNLFAALMRNETRASKAVASAADYLGLALADFVNICDVPTIVLDGLYSKLFEYLKEPLVLKLSKRVLSSKWAKINVLKSISTSNSVAFGAAWKGITKFIDTPSRWKKQIKNKLNYYPITDTPSVTLSE